MSDSTRINAIIVAAGRGERAGLDLPKQFAQVQGQPMVRHSVEAMLNHGKINRTLVVIGEGQESLLAAALAGLDGYHVVTGGDTRQASVFNALTAIAADGGADKVLVHDAARPFLGHEVIDRLLDALQTCDGVIPVLPTVDTVVELNGEYIGNPLDRENIWRVQTPQAFYYNKLLQSHQKYSEQKNATDDAQIFKAAGYNVTTVPGEERLKKLTLAEDFQVYQSQSFPRIQTGMGYDVHRLANGEELWLGGLKIAHHSGLVGHSDADVLLHALTDALLGAIGAGDIGDHFPPSDPKWRGAASSQFLEHAAKLVADQKAAINNVDITVICEAPKIKPHREAIRQNIMTILNLSAAQVSIKATTTEKLGFTGRSEGIAAQAIATISIQD